MCAIPIDRVLSTLRFSAFAPACVSACVSAFVLAFVLAFVFARAPQRKVGRLGEEQVERMTDTGVSFAVNHMTFPTLDHAALLALAAGADLAGVEFRNDLASPLFGGDDPRSVAATAESMRMPILALAEVKRFNHWSPRTRDQARELMDIAVACGARAVSLIPVNDGTGCGNGERQANLRLALRELKPMLEDRDLVGLIEPLGFAVCSLRHKEEAAEAIEALGARGRFLLIHDTFHHFLAGDDACFPAHTGLVHISGVEDASVSAAEMTDALRLLVGPGDRLGNLRQIADLRAAGYAGPYSFEAFSPRVHGIADPGAALASSIDYVNSHLARQAA